MGALGLFVLLFAVGTVHCEDGASKAPVSQPFRLAIILAIVAVLLMVAAIIVCRFACVNFCQSKDGYDKIEEHEHDDDPKEVIVETPMCSEAEDLDSDCEVKQPLPETDPPDEDDDDSELTSPAVSPSANVAFPPRYSHVSTLPKYSPSTDVQEEPEAEEANAAAPMTPLTEKEIASDLVEKKENEKESLAPAGVEGDPPLPSPREDEARSSGDELASPGTSNGTPPPPYDDARSRGSSADRLDEMEDSSPENSAPLEREDEHEPIADTSSDSEDVLLNANAPTLERPRVLNIDEPDGRRRSDALSPVTSPSSEQPAPEGATATAAPVEEDSDEVDGHHVIDDDELNSPSPTVPLDPVVKIESPGGPDESFENDDFIPPRRPSRPRHSDS